MSDNHSKYLAVERDGALPVSPAAPAGSRSRCLAATRAARRGRATARRPDVEDPAVDGRADGRAVRSVCAGPTDRQRVAGTGGIAQRASGCPRKQSGAAQCRSKSASTSNTITRPAVSTERLSLTTQGNIRYRLKTPYRDGTTDVVFEPLDFMARLAALVPTPRVNLTRYHGVNALYI